MHRQRLLLVPAGFAIMALVGSGPAGATPGPCAAVPVVDDRCEAWVASYNHSGGGGGLGEDIGRAVAVGTDGSVVVSGVSRDDSTGQDAVLVGYTATGVQRWAVRSAGAGYDTFSAVTVTPDARTDRR